MEDARHTAEAVLLDRYGLTRLVISTLIDGAHDAHVVSAAALNGALRQETSVEVVTRGDHARCAAFAYRVPGVRAVRRVFACHHLHDI